MLNLCIKIRIYLCPTKHFIFKNWHSKFHKNNSILILLISALQIKKKSSGNLM